MSKYYVPSVPNNWYVRCMMNEVKLVSDDVYRRDKNIKICNFLNVFCSLTEDANVDQQISDNEFSSNPSEREMALRNRKEKMFLNAKKKYLEKRLVN